MRTPHSHQAIAFGVSQKVEVSLPNVLEEITERTVRISGAATQMKMSNTLARVFLRLVKDWD